ncbi:hypothetical protein LR48_Vigan02g046700 [Vigna angularis]|uniref:Uncharacterized protein n=1 Tax=Phaseolus angularis TaxID=3914 RepID=A0A0L9TV72_PHAAN|nr:hypothetical protein LR48_Vigan02g046700 [Vigna angularis]
MKPCQKGDLKVLVTLTMTNLIKQRNLCRAHAKENEGTKNSSRGGALDVDASYKFDLGFYASRQKHWLMEDEGTAVFVILGIIYRFWIVVGGGDGGSFMMVCQWRKLRVFGLVMEEIAMRFGAGFWWLAMSVGDAIWVGEALWWPGLCQGLSSLGGATTTLAVAWGIRPHKSSTIGLNHSAIHGLKCSGARPLGHQVIGSCKSQRQEVKALSLGSSPGTPSAKPNGKARSLGRTPKSKSQSRTVKPVH